MENVHKQIKELKEYFQRECCDFHGRHGNYHGNHESDGRCHLKAMASLAKSKRETRMFDWWLPRYWADGFLAINWMLNIRTPVAQDWRDLRELPYGPNAIGMDHIYRNYINQYGVQN